MAPFLQWNKTRNPADIVSEFPIRFVDFYEPFLGSGEIFFNLYNNGRIFNKAYLANTDKNLIRAYRAVRDEPERLQNMILKYCENNSKQFYENMKHCESTPSAYIYLNKAMDKHGKWRESQFIDKNREISKDVSDIDICSRYLNKWCDGIWNTSWEETLTPLKGLQPNDLVWLEPPKLTYTSDGRIDYVTDGFNESNHVYLNNFCKQLKSKGVHVYMIQSNVPATERIFGKPTWFIGKANQEVMYVY